MYIYSAHLTKEGVIRESKTNVKIGIIGAGQIANQHLGRYHGIDGVEIAAIADVVKAKAEKVAQDFGIPYVYDDPRKMLEQEDITAVDVCVHNNKHMPLTVAALEAGKHVYCEKPMAGSYPDAKVMKETADRVGKYLHIQLAQLYTSHTQVAKKLIDSGRLGRLYHARSKGHRRRGRPYVDGYGNPAFVNKFISGGGALYDMAVYHISRMLFLLGNPAVNRVGGKVYQELPMHEERKRQSGYNVEELALGFVRFENSVTMDIIESWAVHSDKFEGSTVFGNEGGIRIDETADTLEYFHVIDDMEASTYINPAQVKYRWKTVDGIDDAYDSSQHHWVRALQGRTALLPSAEIALNTMLIQEGIFLSDKLGREVGVEDIEKMAKSTALTGEDIYTDDEVLLKRHLSH